MEIGSGQQDIVVRPSWFGDHPIVTQTRLGADRVTIGGRMRRERGINELQERLPSISSEKFESVATRKGTRGAHRWFTGLNSGPIAAFKACEKGSGGWRPVQKLQTPLLNPSHSAACGGVHSCSCEQSSYIWRLRRDREFSSRLAAVPWQPQDAGGLTQASP